VGGVSAIPRRPAGPARAAALRVARAAEVADARWDVLLVCVAAYLLTSVGRVHQLFPALEALHPAALTGALAIGLYLFDQRPERKAARLLVPTTKYLVALLALMMLSVPGALSQGNSFELVFGNFVKTVLMYLVVVGAVRGLRDVERLGAVYLVAATVYAAVVLSRFDLGAGDAWRLGRLYYYDANDFATFTVTAVPLGIYFLHAARGRLLRALTGVALAILALAFVRTGSRGGFIALIAVAAFIVARYTGIPLRWRVAATALVAVVVLATASEQYWTQMGTIMGDGDYNRTDESGRLQIWQRGVGYMLQHPLQGVGPNNFPVAEGTLSPFAARQQYGIGVRWMAAHNSLVQVGAELGFPGLIVFVMFVASAFTALRRAGRRDGALSGDDPKRSQLAQALMGSLLGFVVGAFFLSLGYSEMLYTLVALAVALQKVTVVPARERR
jgi:putative inorganic carbon (hco3(-)) transporter